jgi:tetratricopeptide (TPR) repeat protein
MRISISAAAAAGLLMAAPAFAQEEVYTAPPKQQGAKAPPAAAGAGQVKPSNQALKAIVELQTAVNGNDTANIPAKVAAAQAVATTKEDRYLIGQLQLKAALAANDPAAMTNAVNAIAASGYLDDASTAQLYASLGAKYFGLKQYGQAAAMFERGAALNPTDKRLPLMVADARMAEGRKGDAAAIYQRVLKAQQAAGLKADENLYKRAVQAAYDAKHPSATDLARQWLLAYPGPESWRTSIAIYRNQGGPDVEAMVDVMRLMRTTGALNNSNDLGLYVRILSEQSNFIEAQTVLDKTAAGEGIDAAGLQSLKSTVSAKPKATAAQLASAAKTAQSGMALLRIGDRYYGLGDYAKAAETYRAAKAKGADASLADLRTGVALASAGDKAGATAALKSVTGARAGVAQLWLLYLESRG